MKKTTVLSMALALGFMAGNMASADSNTSYTIKSGDTLSAIAKKFKVSLASVLTANPKLDTNNLLIGSTVNIPVIETSTTAATTTESQYTVQPGDNFWTISQKLNINWNSLIAANPNVTATNIYVGMKINLPTSDTGNTTTSTPLPASDTDKTSTSIIPTTDTENTSTTSNETTTTATLTQYAIKSGDNFWLLSQKYNVPLDTIIKANPAVNPNNLYIGLKVKIPVSHTTSATGSQVPTNSNTTVSTYLADGQFPLKPGTYSPFTDTYGDGRSYNPDGTQQRQHEGVDIMAAKGTPIYSAYDGTVINKGWNTLGGWRLTVKTPDGKTAFYYAHMSVYAGGVEKGSSIKKGQLIGYVGNTGYGPEGTAGLFDPHLHFGMYDLTTGFVAVDPFSNLKYWEKTSVTAKY